MNSLKLITALALTAMPAIAAAGIPIHEQDEIDKEVASCVAEVADHANYEGAAQVRHDVVVTKRRTIGHRLNIRTSVFSEGDNELIRAYATRCVVYRDNKPVRFRISELGEGA